MLPRLLPAALTMVVALLIVVALRLDAVSAVTGSIRGRVLVLAEATAPAVRPRVADLAAQPMAPVDRRRSVVYLESAPRRAFDELRPARVRIDQRGQQFLPRVLAITAGTVVEFPNNDTTFHNAFSLSPVRTFDLGRYRPGRTRSVRFDRPGIVPVFCDIHSSMSAYVLVFSHPYFAVTDEAGNYSLSGVPPGTYSLAIWSELGRAAPREITVASGESVEASFEVGRGR